MAHSARASFVLLSAATGLQRAAAMRDSLDSASMVDLSEDHEDNSLKEQVALTSCGDLRAGTFCEKNISTGVLRGHAIDLDEFGIKHQMVIGPELCSHWCGVEDARCCQYVPKSNNKFELTGTCAAFPDGWTPSRRQSMSELEYIMAGECQKMSHQEVEAPKVRLLQEEEELLERLSTMSVEDRQIESLHTSVKSEQGELERGGERGEKEESERRLAAAVQKLGDKGGLTGDALTKYKRNHIQELKKELDTLQRILSDLSQASQLQMRSVSRH